MDPKYSRVYLDGLLLNYQLNKLMGVIDTSDAVVAVDQRQLLYNNNHDDDWTLPLVCIKLNG